MKRRSWYSEWKYSCLHNLYCFRYFIPHSTSRWYIGITLSFYHSICLFQILCVALCLWGIQCEPFLGCWISTSCFVGLSHFSLYHLIEKIFCTKISAPDRWMDFTFDVWNYIYGVCVISVFGYLMIWSMPLCLLTGYIRVLINIEKTY